MPTSDLRFLLLRSLGLLALCLTQDAAADDSLPYLQPKGSTVQLIVDGEPYVMLSGELHNSSASGRESMRRMWPHLKALELNTVIAPVSWELVEPQEDEFDFCYVDEMIRLARQHDQRLVLLWFGSWKNGVSSYAPRWVLRDTQRFSRAKGSSNQNTKDILSTLSKSNLQADAKAFARLMQHVKEMDGQEHTVILVQVQNEVGIKPETRDLSDEATEAYNSPVAQPLMDYLVAHKDELHPELLARWKKSGLAVQGNNDEELVSHHTIEDCLIHTPDVCTRRASACGSDTHPTTRCATTMCTISTTRPSLWAGSGDMDRVGRITTK